MSASPPQYSLWLLPRSDHEAMLVEHVARLSALVGGTRFAPHVTIHGDLPLSQDTLEALAQAIAAQVPQQHWPITALQAGDHFFRCLYLRFDDHGAFAQLQSAVLAQCATQDGQSPFPHLSLAYGEPHPDNAKLCTVLAEQFAGQTIVLDRIAVARSSKAVPIAEWQVLAEFPLSPNDTTETTAMSTLLIPEGRRHDLACLGRLAVDLYAQQLGARLEDVSSFAKYLGGSSANIAFGVARLGLRAAMVSRVGDEQMGRFLIETLEREGCDTTQVQIDPQRLTALVLLGLKDRDTFPLLFYRENCADMAIDPSLIDESFIADCRALLITGTHLSAPTVRAASTTALAYAARHQVLRVLDIDYRPVLWGLTKRGEGANRFVADAHVTAQLQQMLPHFDLLIGTEEEFLIAGGVAGDLLASLREVRALTPAALVVKLGAAGCCFIRNAIPARLEDALTAQGERVEVMNVLGAGDAFAAGLMTGFLRGMDFVDAARLANACGAIVVSRHACAPAMPTPAELDHWFGGQRNPRVDADRQLAHLHRSTPHRTPRPELQVMAFDHRSQFFELARQAGAQTADIVALKKLLLGAAEKAASDAELDGRIGVLIDGGAYGADALAAATGRGWWVGRPVELPGSRPLRFDGSLSVGSTLVHWPAEQVCKCLVHYHPDDPAPLRLEQELKVQELWQATRASGHELLLEIICPGTPQPIGGNDDAIVRAIKRFYNLGIKPDWWKLAPMAASGWDALALLIAERDPLCRGAVILGLNQPLQVLADSFTHADNPVVKGFMVGRSLWAEPSLRWLRRQCTDQELMDAVAANFLLLSHAWSTRHRHATIRA
ncbi:MAG: 5-dehydro-2-deoxygluconokinase [Rhodoferax sp.]|nr:5-dehydro-2-deoxygluconokinase [Rhodoferax sp.]